MSFGSVTFVIGVEVPGVARCRFLEILLSAERAVHLSGKIIFFLSLQLEVLVLSLGSLLLAEIEELLGNQRWHRIPVSCTLAFQYPDIFLGGEHLLQAAMGYRSSVVSRFTFPCELPHEGFDGTASFSVKMESLLGYWAFFPVHSDSVGNDGEAFIGSGLSHFPQRHYAVSSSSHIYEAVVVLRFVVISNYGCVFLSYADFILSDMGEILTFSWIWSNRGLEGRRERETKNFRYYFE